MLPEDNRCFENKKDNRNYGHDELVSSISSRFSNGCTFESIKCDVRDYEGELCKKSLLALYNTNGELVGLFERIEDLGNGYLACKGECKENKLNNYRKFYDEYGNSMLNEEVYFYKNFEGNLYLNFSYYNDDIYQMVDNLFNRIYPKEYYGKFDSRKGSELTPIGFEFRKKTKEFVLVITDKKDRRYYGSGPFENGTMLVKNGKYHGLINENFKWVVSGENSDYQEIGKLVNGFRIIKSEGRGFFFMNNDGNKVGNYYEATKNFSNGFAAVKNYINNWGFIDTNGNLIADYEFSEVNDFEDDKAKVKKIIGGIEFNFYINNKGEYLLDSLPVSSSDFISDEQIKILLKLSKRYKDIKIISNNVYAVKNEDKEKYWLLVDEEGNIILDNKFCEFRNESEGYLAVSFYAKKNGENKIVRNYIDTKGNLLNSKEYILVSDFKDGCAYVKEDSGNAYYINKNGESVPNS